MGVLFTSPFTMPQLNPAEEKAAREKLSDEISALKKQIDDCSSKFEQAKTQQEQQQKKLQVLIDKSTTISKQMKAIQKERQVLFDKRDELNNSSKRQFKELLQLSKELPLSSWKKDLPVEKFIEPNRERIQTDMANLQAQMLQMKNMSDERRLVSQINKLKALELSLTDFEEKVKADKVERDLADQYQAEAQGKKEELDRLYQEMQSVQDKISPLKETLDNLRGKITALITERKGLYGQRDKKRAELNERWTKWKAHLEQQKKKEAEALDKTPPYAASLTAAKTCLSRLQNLQKKRTNAPEEEKPAADGEAAEPVQTEVEEPAEPESVPLTHDLSVYRAFEALSMLPPTESSQIHEAIEKVKARQQELKRLNDQVMKNREESANTETKEEPQEEPAKEEDN